MKTTNKIFANVLLVSIMVALLSFDIPNGWYKRGTASEKYDAGIAKGEGENGKNAGTIKSIADQIDGFGTLSQDIKPDKFLRKKIKFSGYVKSKDVISYGMLFLIFQSNRQKSEPQTPSR